MRVQTLSREPVAARLDAATVAIQIPASHRPTTGQGRPDSPSQISRCRGIQVLRLLGSVHY